MESFPSLRNATDNDHASLRDRIEIQLAGAGLAVYRVNMQNEASA
jgi:hypothetical protein